MSDVIVLAGIRALGVVGLLPEERERAQPFEVDLEIEADLTAAGRSDDIADTVDYGKATEIAVAVVTGESHLLIERVAERIAQDLLELERVEAVEVTVRKLRPPVAADMEYSAVRIRRRK